MIFGIVERGNDRKNILGLLLSINLNYNPEDNIICFLSCCPETKKYIDDFPFDMQNIKIVYFLFAVDNEMKGMDKLFNILYVAIKKYGECCFIDTTLFMMHRFDISDEIKKKGIGVVKYKSIRTCEAKKLENYRYSAQVLYLNDLKYVDDIKKYYEEDVVDISNNEVDISNNELDISNNEVDVSNNEVGTKKLQLIVKDFSNNVVKSNVRKTIPVYLKDKYNVDVFFEKYTLIDLHEFTAFEDEIKVEELESDFKIGDKYVNFLCLNCNTMNPKITYIYKTIIAKAANKSREHLNIINLKKSDIPIIQPKKEGAYKWDRTQDPSGMYQLTEMIADNEYFSLREEYEDYFMVGNNILMDKDSDFHISNRSSSLSEFYLCNYSKTLTDALDSIEKPYQFFAYYSEYPKILEEFTKDKKFEKTIDYVEIKDDKLVFHSDDRVIKTEPSERNSDYESFLHQLKNVKYGYCSEGDIHLIATYLSLNIVPVVDSDWLLDLEEGVHYETKRGLMKISYEEYVDNIEKYVKSNIKVEGLVRKLLSKILIRHV